MSQENVELALQSAEAFNRRNLNAVLALMADDVETVSRLVAMEGPYHGHDGVRRWWENLLGAYPDLSVEVVEARDLGDFTLTHQRLRGRGAGSGTPVEEPRWVVHEWRDGKIVWWSPQYAVEAEALEAVGSSPSSIPRLSHSSTPRLSSTPTRTRRRRGSTVVRPR